MNIKLAEKVNKIFSSDRYNPLDNKLIHDYNHNRPEGPKPILCYAPFASLRFTQSGNAVACCFNKQHTLGKYPENSIYQMWFGDKIKRLRKYIINNDLSLGCQSCRKSIINNNFDLTGARLYDYLDHAPDNYPLMLEFELNNTCNLECIMCSGGLSSSIRQNKEKNPPYMNHYDSDFVTQLEEFIPHLQETIFAGGEPFLIDLYYDIWERILKMNKEVSIAVVTNATILNNKVKELLGKGNFNFRISIDSLQKENYERIRENANFEKVMSNFNYFYDYAMANERNFYVNVCPMRQNWKEMPDFINFGNNKDIPINFITVRFPPFASLWNLEPDKLIEIIDYLNGFTFPGNNEIQKMNRRTYNTLLNQLNFWHSEAMQRKKDNSIADKNLTELKEIFQCRIRQYIANDKTIKNKSKKKKILAKYLLMSEKVFKSINNESMLKKSLININQIPVETVASEMKLNTFEHIIERFKQAGQ